jgi:hypothetical protein
MSKLEIAKVVLDGNLTGGFKQEYRINIMPPEVVDDKLLCTKLEVALITPGKDKKEVYHSLRFSEPGQARIFLLKFAEAYGRFVKANGLDGVYPPGLCKMMGGRVEEKVMVGLKGE